MERPQGVELRHQLARCWHRDRDNEECITEMEGRKGIATEVSRKSKGAESRRRARRPAIAKKKAGIRGGW